MCKIARLEAEENRYRNRIKRKKMKKIPFLRSTNTPILTFFLSLTRWEWMELGWFQPPWRALEGRSEGEGVQRVAKRIETYLGGAVGAGRQGGLAASLVNGAPFYYTHHPSTILISSSLSPLPDQHMAALYSTISLSLSFSGRTNKSKHFIDLVENIYYEEEKTRG